MLSTVWEDYDANRKLALKSATGTYTPVFNNPSVGGVNTSAKVGKYVRSAAQQWDLLIFTKGTATVDGKALKERRQKIAVDIYTDAPVGTEISIGIDASTLATADNYPTGRHSNYQAFTKVQNAWHTVYFTFATAPDPSTPDNLIDNIAVLFDPGKLTGNTYHIDNIRVFNVVPETSALSSIVVSPTATTLLVGATAQFTAQGKDANGNNVSVTPTWSTTGGGTISSSGLFTATTAGSFEVRATSGSIIGTANVTVNAASGSVIPGKIEAESYTTMLGVQKETTTDTGGGQNVGYIDAGDYMDYPVVVQSSGNYTVTFRTAGWNAAAQVQLKINTTVLATVNIPNSGGGQNWATTTPITVPLTAGNQTIRVQVATGGFNFNWMNFATGGGNVSPTVSITAPANNATITGLNAVTLSATANDGDGTISKVEFYVNGNLHSTDTSSPYSASWTPATAGSYALTAKAFDNQNATTTSTAVNVTVTTGTPGTSIPGKIEAENYATMSGVAKETTADTGGGQNIGYIDANDWMDYPVTVSSAGSYAVTFRVAGWAANAQLQLKNGATVLATVSVPVSGGGQNWVTTTATNVTLPAGNITLRVAVVNGGFNFNWMNFTSAGARMAAPEEEAVVRTQLKTTFYPNPSNNTVSIEGVSAYPARVTIHNENGVVFTKTYNDSKQPIQVDLANLKNGIYYITIKNKNSSTTEKIVKE